MNLRDALAKAAREYDTKTAIVYGERRLTYHELECDSNRMAYALKGLGVGKGDRVAMLLNNNPEFVIVFFGIAKIGAIAVPLDTKYKHGELAALFHHSQPKVLVTENPYLEQLAPSLGEFPFIEHVIGLDRAENVSYHNYSEMIALSPEDPVSVEVDAEDIAQIAYTSGPTTRPRGSLLCHRNFIEEAAISAAGFQQTGDDIVVLFALPMHHVFGLTIIMMTSLFKGSTVVMQPALSMSSLFETIEREKVTLLMGVPYIFALAVNMAEKEGLNHDLSSLRLCASSGASLPMKVRERFKHYYGFGLVELWGLTEATAHIACQSISGTDHPGSVGRVLPGWEAAVIDEHGRRLAAGEVGEIIVRGPIMKGYYRNPEDTAQVLRGGWLYTGDLGKFDAGGELYLMGLKKDIIIVKGQNVHPIDIETVLCSHMFVAEAAVVGIPDETKGEKIRAVVSLRDGLSIDEAELQGFCRQHLANYKVPKQIIVAGKLPREPGGQVSREKLRQP
ncbi:MAG: AMP-binding protein [Dehalococcoidales bacterium]